MRAIPLVDWTPDIWDWIKRMPGSDQIIPQS
ncbi:hypothetical protein [Allomuricauda sp. CAU 1633]